MKNAQSAVKKSLQSAKNAKTMSEVKKKELTEVEAAEQKERWVLTGLDISAVSISVINLTTIFQECRKSLMGGPQGIMARD